MQVTVQGYLTLKPALGRRQYRLPDHPPPNLQDLLEHLQVELGGDVPGLEIDPLRGKPTGELVLLLNGQHLSHLAQGNRTQLHDGDVLSIFPPIAGG
jgi:molybdopterin converting factor small subunit